MIKTGHFDLENAARVFFAERGTGPVVLFLHGFPSCWFSWHKQIQYFSDIGYRAIAIDLPGMGQSKLPTSSGQTNNDYAEMLTPFITMLAKSSKINLVGHGLGADIAYQVGINLPTKINAIAGISSAFGGFNHKPVWQELTHILHGQFFFLNYLKNSKQAALEISENLDQFIRQYYSSTSAQGQWSEKDLPATASIFDAMGVAKELPTWLADTLIHYTVSSFRQQHIASVLGYFDSLDATWAQFVDKKFETLKVPCLYVSGESDPFLQYDYGNFRRMDKACDNFYGRKFIKQAGHWPQLEASKPTNKALASFLHSVNQRQVPSSARYSHPKPLVPSSTRSISVAFHEPV